MRRYDCIVPGCNCADTEPPETDIERERDEWKARAEEAEADFLAVAQACGITYDAEGQTQAPGPVEVIVARIRDMRAREGEAIDAASKERSRIVALVREMVHECPECYCEPGIERLVADAIERGEE